MPCIGLGTLATYYSLYSHTQSNRSVWAIGAAIFHRALAPCSTQPLTSKNTTVASRIKP